MIVNRLLFFLMAWGLALPVQADVFLLHNKDKSSINKWVDDEGKVHFSASGFAQTRQKPLRTESDQSEPNDTAPPVVVQNPLAPPDVEVYFASWCPFCQKALAFFRKHHIVIKEYDIEADPAAAERKRQLDPNFTGMPLVVINGVLIRGLDEEAYQNALNRIKASPVPPP